MPKTQAVRLNGLLGIPRLRFAWKIGRADQAGLVYEPTISSWLTTEAKLRAGSFERVVHISLL